MSNPWTSNTVLVDPNPPGKYEDAIIVYADREGTHASLVRRESLPLPDRKAPQGYRTSKCWTFKRDLISVPGQNLGEVAERLRNVRNVNLQTIQLNDHQPIEWKTIIDKAKLQQETTP